MSTRSSSNYVRRRARPEASKRARTREQEILDAGISIFAEKGYLETSTEDIGAAVGLLRGSLYYYIRSKEELLYRILLETHEHYLAQVEEVRAQDSDGLTKLRELVRRHILTSEDVRLRKLYVSEFRHLNGARKREIVAMRKAYQDFFVELISIAQSEGSCAANMEPDVVAAVILHNINSMIEINVESVEARQSFADVADRILVKGLAP